VSKGESVNSQETSKKASGPINVAVALDRRVAWGCAVTLRSMIENSAPGSSFAIFVLHDDLPESDIRALEKSWAVEGRSASTTFTNVQLADVSEVVRSKDLSRMSYARLLLGAVLPAEVKRCIYLDTDLLVERDINELFDLDLGEKTIAAVPDGSEAWDREQLARLGVKGEHYFNAGVLLIDLEGWRRDRIGERAFDFCQRARPKMIAPMKYGWFFHDQDALNTLLAGRVRSLPTHWNSWASRMKGYEKAVIHLITGPKPWHADYAGMFGERFFAYLDRTAYRGCRPPRLMGMAPVLKRLRRRIPYPPTVWRMLKESARFVLARRKAEG